MKKENTGEQRKIYSIRKNKAYGASSVLIGLMGSAFLLSGLAPTVQAEENDAKPETKPADGSAVNGTNAPTVETEHLIIASQPNASEPKSESTPTDNPKSNVENNLTNETKPVNSESPQSKEEPAAPVKQTEVAKQAETGTTEAKPSAETTPSKRAVSIVYKVRYVDRKSHKVVHEVTKTKTVETTEAKAKASVTEIGGELANDSQLENYYVPDGNPTTMTKEIVEGEDNVFVYEVEGFGEAETPKERTVALKYTVEYVDKKSGLVLASEEKEEKVSTTEKVAKKEITVQPSLATNEKLKDWVLSEDAPASQKLTLTEGTVGKVTFNLQNSEGGKVRNKRKVQTSNIDGQPYLTLENYTVDHENRESMTFPGNGKKTYEIKYKFGFSKVSESEIEMTQGAKDLNFNWDKTTGYVTATLTPTREMNSTYEVGFYVKSNPEIKVSGTIHITKTTHYGFMIMNDQSGDYVPYFYNVNEETPISAMTRDNYTDDFNPYYSRISPFYGRGESTYLDDYVENNFPKTEVTVNGLRMPSTPFGYFMPNSNTTVEAANENTKRYYTMLPIFAPMDRSTDFANNDKQGLSITKFKVLEASDGVEAKLIDLRHDKAPDKGVYRNNLDYKTVTEYSGTYAHSDDADYTKTPYYLQFTRLPKVAGNYFATVEITDSLGLTKKIRLNFTTYENSISGNRVAGGESHALTTADTLFEVNKEYVDENNGVASIPTSNKEQILGKVVLNKENAFIKPNEFPTGVKLRTIKGTDENPTEAYVVKMENVKITPGSYSFKVTARDGHFQEGGVRSFNFDVVDAINPIADQHWRESSVPTPIPVSMENGSKITGIRVESSGGYAVFEGNPNDSNISIYGLKRTTEPQKARVYVTFIGGDKKTHTTFTDFNYVIDPNTVEGLEVSVTNSTQEISEGQSWQDMVITTTPSEGVTIKVDKTKLPIGTRVVGNIIKGKALYEGVYEIPILAVKGDIVKSTAVHLTVKPGEFVVSPETSEVEVLTNDIKAITTEENGEIVKTSVSRYGLQNIPKGAKVIYRAKGYAFSESGMKISADSTEITGTPTRAGLYTLDAVVNWRTSNGVTRTATTTYNINVTGLTPRLSISSEAQPEHPIDAYTDSSYRLIAPMGSPIPTITIKQEPHSSLTLESGLPEGLRYLYDEATHTGTITGTPNKLIYRGNIHKVSVKTELDSTLVKEGESNYIEKYIYIEVVPETSPLEINPAEQTFAANENMTPITVSGVDTRATVELDGAPAGVSYNKVTHQITGAPISGVGDYSFNVRAIMPESTGGEVTTKGVTLHVRALEPSLSATPSSATVEITNRIPDITITKDPLSELAVPTVTIGGTGDPKPLSELGLSYDATSRTITGTPTVVGSHTIHLSTTLSRRYTGVDGGVTKTLDIPVTVRAKEFDFVTNQEQTTTVLSPITPINLTVPERIEVSVSELPSGLTYDAERKIIQGTPNKVGTHTITVTGRPRGFSGNDKIATLTIHVNNLPATIGITNKEQTVQVGTAINDVTVTSSEHANIYGIDALLSAVSGNNSGIVEANIANYFLGAYGLTYNATNHTITGTPTKTGRIVFTFIARTSENLGAAEARETVVLNVVESLSKIPVITEVREGTSVVKGTGVAGATVTVTLPTGDEKTALVSGDGSWSVDTTSPLGKGQSISARQKEVNKTMSNDISATVVANAGLELSKEPIVDAIIEGATTITGKGENGSTINVTLPNGTVKTTTVTDGRWTVTLESPVAKGDNILVSQTQPNKATSPSVSATVVPTITNGTNGKDGFTPDISVTPNDDGSYTITITQPGGKEPIKTTVKNGTNGSNGTNGTNGRDGRTPKVLLTPIYENPAQPRTRRPRSVDNTADQPTGKQIGVHITVYFDNNNSGTYDEGDELISEKDIYDGVDGRDGKDILSGKTDPTPETGKDGDKYVNTETGEVFVKENGTWKSAGNLKGPKGDKGEAGAAGENGQNGRDGQNGQNGRDGKDILSGKTDPTPETGKDGDKYVNTETGEVFVKENGTWKSAGNLKGPKGDKGEAGAAGQNGQNGRDGKDILSGKTDPTPETGKDGDKYVNTETGEVFVKENGTWKSAGNLKGPKGDKGETGAAGQNGENGQNGRDGKDILSGTSDPTSETGKEGDKYVNTTTGDIFVKKNGQWEREGNLKGPKGDKGDTPTITTQPGADGISTDIILTLPGKEPITVNVKNGMNGRDGLNGKSLVVKKEGNETKIYVEDPANPGQPLDPTKPLATILDGLKGDKGEGGTNGVDGKSPVITMTDNGDGTHSIIIRNPDGSESTTKVKDGKDGKTATITTTENPDGSHTITVINPDGASKEIVVRDGKTPKLEVIDNGNGTHTVKVTDGDGNVTNTIIKDGKDGKSATATTTENPDGSHTVTITNPDGTTNNFIVKNGRDGVDGRTPTATVRNNNDGSHTIVITNPDGVTTETTIRDGQSPKVTITDEQNGTHKITVLNGDGTTTEMIIKDGKSPVATVTDNHDGTYTIRVENGNGTVSETTVRDGKSPTAKVVNNGDGTHTVTIVNSDGTTTTTIVRDGQSPKLEVIDNHNGSHTIKVIGSDGKETSTTIFDGKSPTAKIVDNGDGTHTVIIVDSNGQQYTSIIRDGKDGKDGKSPTATVRNNNDGTHTITIINPDGSKTETIIKDGKDGKSPEVTVQDNGNGTYTITIINVNGIVYKTIIRDGKCGCNDKPGGHTSENPTNPGVPTFAMPAPPVHDKPEFKGGVPGMPVVHEKPEYPGIPTNPSSDETTPGTPTPETSMNPNPGVPTSEGTTNPNPGVPTPEGTTNPNSGVPTSEGSTNPDPGLPTSVGSTNPKSDVPTSEGLTQSNPEASSAVNEHPSGELPKTGTKAEYLPMLLASGALLTLYIGRRKEEEE